MKCEWCEFPMDILRDITIEGLGKWNVCNDCIINYVSGNYEYLMNKIRQVRGNPNANVQKMSSMDA